MATVAHGVQAQHERVGLARLEGVGEQPAQDGLRPGRERGREPGDGGVVQGEQGRVQVVEARVDEVQTDHRAAGALLDLRMRVTLGAEARAREHQVADHGQVALALVHGGGGDDLAEAVRLQPGRVGGGLPGAFGVGEPGADRDPVDHERAVGGEDHVGQAGDRRELEHLVPEVAVGVAQRLPLPDRQGRVHHHTGRHPRVDRVLHGEVHRGAHEEPSADGDAVGGHRVGGEALPGHHSGHDPTVRRPRRTCQGQLVLSDARIMRL